MTSSDTAIQYRPLTKPDFDQIVQVLDRWWDGPSPERAHPMFVHEFGETAWVAEAGSGIAGFLLGFHTTGSTPTAYVYLVGIHPDFRRRGVGRALYERFSEAARAAGLARVKAISAVGLDGPIRFHEAQGFEVREEPDYAGPGRARLVFIKAL